jgi:hypothetical protein
MVVKRWGWLLGYLFGAARFGDVKKGGSGANPNRLQPNQTTMKAGGDRIPATAPLRRV